MSNQKTSSKKKAPSKQKSSNRTWLWVGLAVIAVIAVVAVVFLRNGNNAGDSADNLPAEIDVNQAAQLRDSGAFILDVREPSEWQEYHIPGATLIPLGELATRVNEVPQDKEVVVVCRSGNRSQQGRDILKNAGLEQVTSMAGGMKEWMASGFQWVTGQ
jgi:rhodanese-related sulfurtransferase